MKRPAFQFYPGDWLRATKLRSCSVGARGLWIDMICLMHEGSPYGYLKVGSKVILPPNLARMVGASLAETEGWLAELEHAEVFSRDEAGCTFSRRMVRDEEVRAARASGGVLGGNPRLKIATPKVNLPTNLHPTPASAVASASKDLNLLPLSAKPAKPKSSRRKPKTEIPVDFGISDGVQKWAAANRFGNLPAHLEAFRLSCETHGYAYSNWDSAFKRAIRDDWAKLKGTGGSRIMTVLPDLPRRDGDIPAAARAQIAKLKAHHS